MFVGIFHILFLLVLLLSAIALKYHKYSSKHYASKIKTYMQFENDDSNLQSIVSNPIKKYRNTVSNLFIQAIKTTLITTSLLTSTTSSVIGSEINDVIETKMIISREEVGLIDLNVTQPAITDICWFDISLGNNSDVQRIEISLYGKVCPKAVANFKSLCSNELGYGYAGSDIFRVISEFSIQGGNIGQPIDALPSQLSKYGLAGKYDLEEDMNTIGKSFTPDNFRILHSYKDAGVISMMRDITNKGMLDSRFFITTSPYASWADDKYEAFGRVTKGMNIISAMQIIPVQPPSNYPLSPIKIMASGYY